MVFNALCKSILLYGVEIWGYEKFEEVEKIKKQYIKWAFKIDRCTPDYLVRREMKEHELYIETIERAMKYEEKIIKGDETGIVYETLRRKILKMGKMERPPQACT